MNIRSETSRGLQFTVHELERYDRQIRIPGFGVEGQAKLKNATVLVVGVGGLGSASSMYLAAAGVGKLIIVDSEAVELSNLNRQVLHWTKDLGRLKVDSAAEKLRQLNPEVKVEAVAARVDEDNVQGLVKEADVVVDGLDNFRTRFMVNEACVRLGKPFIYAGVRGFEGRLMTIVPGKGPCLRCLVPVDPKEPRPIPVFGATPAVMAALQVVETIKLLTGVGEALIGKLLVFNGLTMTFDHLLVERSPRCPTCRGR
ncbi:MAG: adenylyltransferase [Thermoprotei archaeon]|nr:MAG: adenylyltransferase [Thermoprotei archaeon]